MLFWLFFSAFVAAFILILSYIDIAKKYGIVDKPDARRNHIGELVRGGGIVLLLCSIVTYIAYLHFYEMGIVMTKGLKILLISLILGLIFFIEDIRQIRRSIRFFTQILCAVLGAIACKDAVVIFEIPYILNFILVVIGWVWFMNLYNFMDGIDGITASNTLFFLFAIILIVANIAGGTALELKWVCVWIIPAFLAFLLLNWHPSRIIIGDSGSIAFGFILGYIFLELSSLVGLVIPIILCSYYLLDSGITIASRLLKKEDITTPHSKHFFQIAVRGGLKPNQICYTIMCANIANFGLTYMLLLRNNTLNITLSIALCGIINACILRFFYSHRKFHRA